jgi:signal transduction histidine kinase
LSNGIKFTPAGGRVTLACAANGATTAFSVIDTGIGIDAKDLERIFEQFVQTAYVYTRESGGTGLGLAISRRLAQLMGGRLSVESTVGQGATFTLTLPSRERRRRRR